MYLSGLIDIPRTKESKAGHTWVLDHLSLFLLHYETATYRIHDGRFSYFLVRKNQCRLRMPCFADCGPSPQSIWAQMRGLAQTAYLMGWVVLGRAKQPTCLAAQLVGDPKNSGRSLVWVGHIWGMGLRMESYWNVLEFLEYYRAGDNMGWTSLWRHGAKAVTRDVTSLCSARLAVF